MVDDLCRGDAGADPQEVVIAFALCGSPDEGTQAASDLYGAIEKKLFQCSHVIGQAQRK